jgi:hypothetical protein
MLDANEAHLTKIGRVVIDDLGIEIEGFEAANGSCRDLAALAALWAIGELQRELMGTLQKPGGGNIVIGD